MESTESQPDTTRMDRLIDADWWIAANEDLPWWVSDTARIAFFIATFIILQGYLPDEAIITAVTNTLLLLYSIIAVARIIQALRRTYPSDL